MRTKKGKKGGVVVFMIRILLKYFFQEMDYVLICFSGSSEKIVGLGVKETRLKHSSAPDKLCEPLTT